jgi:hypothetical protein
VEVEGCGGEDKWICAVGTGDTLDEYYEQNVEVAARAYANHSVEDYYTRITDH